MGHGIQAMVLCRFTRCSCGGDRVDVFGVSGTFFFVGGGWRGGAGAAGCEARAQREFGEPRHDEKDPLSRVAVPS